MSLNIPERIDSDEFVLNEVLLKINLIPSGTRIKKLNTGESILTLKNLISIDNYQDRALENYIATAIETLLSSVDITAAENLLQFQPVTISGSRADTASDRPAVAFTLSGMTSGEKKKCLLSGFLENPLWNFTAGLPVYLNGTGISNNPASSGFVQKIGESVSATKIFIKIAEPVFLS